MLIVFASIGNVRILALVLGVDVLMILFSVVKMVLVTDSVFLLKSISFHSKAKASLISGQKN